MSEKRSCPRCDAYLSEVYYDCRHRWCGWNCSVEWRVGAYSEQGHAELVLRVKPTVEQREEVAALVGKDGPAEVFVVVDGEAVDPPLSPWLDPDKESPSELSREGKRRAARAKKRAELLAEAARRIDEELGED